MINVARIEFTDNPNTEELRGYDVLHIQEQVMMFIWNPNTDCSESLIYPIHRIKDVSTERAEEE